ncbi:MAG: DUF2244 domain-containing protein [Rhodopila sp.]|nr:DUF2244 domain-containing protein [Rhodopila sp.]
MSSVQANREPPVFEALIVPHRSLTRKGIALLVAAFVALSVAMALRFWLLGAWPVVAFTLAEVPLAILLVAINLRQARASELIMLTAYEVTVIRTDPAGRRQQVSLPSDWLRVDLEAAGGASHVMLSSRGRGCEIGSFLHEPDKKSLFEGLREALYRIKNPRFDNPQLREGETLVSRS